MKNLLIRNISFVLSMDVPFKVLRDATILIESGRIVFVGPDAACPKSFADVVDATGCVVMPGLIDCHTHVVFAGDRVDDFYARAKGETYAQIMARGGGIAHTVKHTRSASIDDLVALAKPYLSSMLARGVTTVEAKSGYGLNLDDELKILRAIKRLNEEQPITLVPTFLGAHAVPPEFSGRSQEYVDYLIAQVLPQIAREKLATHVDVFVEAGAFSESEARELLEAARALGLGCKVHADQLSHSGGSRLAAELKVASASHLEHASDAELNAFAGAGVVAEILPLSELYLGLPKVADVRRLCDRGVRVAIATDFNPGSAMCDDLQLAMRLAITQRKMTVEEAYLGVTHFAACALGLEKEIGQIKVGMKGDLILLSTPSPWSFAADWTRNPVRDVIKSGAIVASALSYRT